MTEAQSKFNVDLNPENISKNKQEFDRFLIALNTMECYYNEACWYINKIENDWCKLPKYQLDKVPFDFRDMVKRQRETTVKNNEFLCKVVNTYRPSKEVLNKVPNLYDLQRNYSMVSHLCYAVPMYVIRDWNKESAVEREAHYGAIIKEVKKYFDPKNKPKILVPGASLCRLGYELAKLGYDTESNEYSYFNAMITDYIINHSKKDENIIYPSIHAHTNFLNEDANYKGYTFPDEDITENLSKESSGRMHMTVGDFCTEYKEQKGTYDCVITCFFIDTGKNFLDYFDVIEYTLKKGGIWINFGPLSYHQSNSDSSISIELPYNKLREVIKNYGFEFKNEEIRTVKYCEVKDYMMNPVYDCAFFTAEKI